MTSNLRCFLLIALCSPTARVAAELPVVDMNLPEGFVAEQVYEVPNKTQGSWISMAVDDKGRLITSDQMGGLYRVTPPMDAGASTVVEPIGLNIGMAMGLLHFNSTLYVMVNGTSAQGPGLYAVTDQNNDDRYDTVRLLRGIVPPGRPGQGHGNHAIVPSPDGQSLYLICGNMTGFPVNGFDSSRVPLHWGEDQLLPRLNDPRGHAATTKAPGGYVAKTDLEGRKWELVCSGFRNIYDAAFNESGDLFTFDADMEFDIGTPWYRPTRVCHVVSGGEFGWRSGSGKWPEYFPDNLPAVVDIGPGSPTGVMFGYKTNFPEPYRSSIFLCDWSYGRIFVADLNKQGASYTTTHRPFASRAPLPVTTLLANPHDGAMYMVTGGRNVQSHIYRIRYTGSDTTAPKVTSQADSVDDLHVLRRKLEQLHAPMGEAAVSEAWPYLSHKDRHIRFAARIALEHQPAAVWRNKALQETNPQALITAAIGLCRKDGSSGDQVVAALTAVDFTALNESQQLEYLRAVSLAYIRSSSHRIDLKQALGQKLLPYFPASSSNLNRELCRVLAYLNPAGVLAPSLDLLDSTTSREDQVHIAAMLRTVKSGWTDKQRLRYFQWHLRSRNMAGGRGDAEFIAQIRKDAVSNMDFGDRLSIADILLELDSPVKEPAPQPPRPVVQKWTVEDFGEGDLSWSQFHLNDHEQGKALFAAASCVRCHRLNGEGGIVGPDLTSISRRFSPRDMLEAIIHPDKTVPSDYQSVSVVTKNGKVITGQIVNLSGQAIALRTDAMSPATLTNVPQADIEEIVPSKTSLMPAGLLDTLTKDEVYQLMAWLKVASTPPNSSQWVELFNGKDLTGWKADMHSGNFTVVDGVLKAHGQGGMSHLFFTGEKSQFATFRDFELEAEVKGEPSSNSGIFFHTNYELRSEKYLNVGYEVQLNSTQNEKRKTGSLYGVVDLDTSPVDETEWFTIRIRVQGKRIAAWINGESVLDYEEPNNPERTESRAKRLISPTGGGIALQAHDPESVFYFRKIRIREL